MSELKEVRWREDQLLPLLKRNRFSEYLPYMAYDPETGFYHNKDGTVGLIFWEFLNGKKTGNHEPILKRLLTIYRTKAL